MYNNRQTMLINNLQQHRQKYAKMAKSGSIFESYKPQSATKIVQTTAKTQTSSALKCKFGSQKKIRMDPHHSTTRTNSIVSKFDLYEKSNQTNKNQVKFANERKNHQQSGSTKKPLFFKTQCIQNSQRKQPEKYDDRYLKTQQKYDKYGYRNQPTQLKQLRNTIQVVTNNNQETTPNRYSARKTQQQIQKTMNMNMNKMNKNEDEDRKQQILSGNNDILKLTTSIATVKSNYKSIMVQPQKTKQQKQKEEEMIKQLKFHDVFFCGYCYRYIFAIEKNYHYPKCEAKGEEQKLEEYKKYKMGLQKLNLLVQLSQYTKYKSAEMKQIYNDITQRNKIPQFLIKLKGQTYYTLLQVETAAHIIIRKLILPYLLLGKSKQYLCDKVACDRNYQL